ncbi:AfsR/SARP family transcriptional regulator [Nocardia fluminea]|uniref:AfsR/SARP family transcriptional regulator n=1 Tax=Nocardia fluminea TaxID=134984 RepID=UPI003D0F96C6
MTPDIEIKILGPIEVYIRGANVTVPGRKLKNILALLALRPGQEMRRDELIDELDLLQSSKNAANTLHAHVARLRRWLFAVGGFGGSEIIESTQTGYRLNVPPSAVDADRFSTVVERATLLSRSAPFLVATLMADALDLWHGEALMDGPDGPATSAAVDRLNHDRSAARELLLDSLILLDNDRQIIKYARGFIVDDPLNEMFRAALVAALRRSGRYTEAIDTFRAAQDFFLQELGVEPSGRLRTELDLIRRHLVDASELDRSRSV